MSISMTSRIDTDIRRHRICMGVDSKRTTDIKEMLQCSIWLHNWSSLPPTWITSCFPSCISLCHVKVLRSFKDKTLQNPSSSKITELRRTLDCFSCIDLSHSVLHAAYIKGVSVRSLDNGGNHADSRKMTTAMKIKQRAYERWNVNTIYCRHKTSAKTKKGLNKHTNNGWASKRTKNTWAWKWGGGGCPIIDRNRKWRRKRVGRVKLAEFYHSESKLDWL